MARYCSLFSGSTGNCYYVGASGHGIIIDAGVSMRTAVSAMVSKKINLSTIDGILITHEHTDHIKGLTPLVKHLKVPVYGTKLLLDYLEDQKLIPVGARLIEMNGMTDIGLMQVKPFLTSHDCISSCGYKFFTDDKRVISHTTDLGYISNSVGLNLNGSDMVVIESNYDKKMLADSGYPPMLKARIMGKTGHLSNDDCAEEILKLIKTGTTRFMLAHLSRENNRPSIAYQTTKEILTSNGFVEGKDYTLHIAAANSPSDMIIV
ncbi:MAG: MBL fold metallo-hydrolase [Oscillospiraceae bacterium]